MTIDNIKQLIKKDENRVLELKKTTGELVKGMQSLCAFLNSDGGWLFFGISPKLEILGQNVTDSTQREIAHEITKIEPAIKLPMELVDVPGRKDSYVIGIHAEPAKYGDAPYTYNGRAFYKVESTTVLMPRSMFEERLRRSDPKRFAWESQTPDTLHLEDLDEGRIKGCVQYGAEKGRMPASSVTETTMMLLDKFAMVENGRIKNAAAALFSKHSQDYPQFLLRMARFKGKDKMLFIDNMRVQGNFFELLDAGMSFFFKHLNQSGIITGVRREEQLEIPVEALREALTNALCHRLLDSPSGSVGISIYDDRVEIENTGHLPSELTVETIKQSHRSYPQNPIIANALFKTGFLESWGSGVGRMIEACKSAGIPEPEYGTDGLFVWVTFKRPSLDTNLDTSLDTNFDTSLDTNLNTNADINPDDFVLSSKQKEVLMYCMVARSSREILKYLNVSNHSKNRERFINALVDAGYLEKTEPGARTSPNQKYIVKHKA